MNFIWNIYNKECDIIIGRRENIIFKRILLYFVNIVKFNLIKLENVRINVNIILRDLFVEGFVGLLF